MTGLKFGTGLRVKPGDLLVMQGPEMGNLSTQPMSIIRVDKSIWLLYRLTGIKIKGEDT